MGIRVEPVASARDLDEFVKLPWRLYRDDPCWVPPLIREQKKLFDRQHHPFYAHGDVQPFLARDGQGRVVGRIAAIENQLHQQVHGDRVGFFGFYESENTPEVAAALLHAAECWLADRGLDVIRGPMNFSTNDEIGFLLDGFDTPPYLLMPHTHRYYLDLMERCGFYKVKDLYAYVVTEEILEAAKSELERWRRLAEQLKVKRKVVVRPARMDRFDEEVARLKEVYNQSWVANWGFVPFTDAEIDQMAKDFRDIVLPDLVLFAELEGRPIGVMLTLPDFNQVLKRMNGRLFPFGIFQFLWYRRKINRVRTLALGIVPEWRKRGIAPLLIVETMDRGLKMGYREAELSWVLEDNALMNNSIQSLGFVIHKRYRIFEKGITRIGPGERR